MTDNYKDNSEWTLKSIKTLMDERESRNVERFASMKLAIDAALAASQRAIEKAETATEKRFDSVNEFRKTLSDQTATFISRNEYGIQQQSMVDKINSFEKLLGVQQLQLTSFQTRETTKAQSVTFILTIIGGIIAAITALGTIGAVFIHFRP